MHNKVICINLGGVNCYLLEGTAGFMLIDSGFFAKRKVLTERLQEVGCKAGNLRIVVLTHGDDFAQGRDRFRRAPSKRIVERSSKDRSPTTDHRHPL